MDPTLAHIPEKERQRLAMHQLAVAERATEKIAALLDCSARDAINQARAVRRRAVDAL